METKDFSNIFSSDEAEEVSYKIRAKTYEDILADIDDGYYEILYKREITAGLNVFVGRFSYNTYMTLLIRDEISDRFVLLKLKSFRKIVKWMFKIGFSHRARTLSYLEKAKMDGEITSKRIVKAIKTLEKADFKVLKNKGN